MTHRPGNRPFGTSGSKAPSGNEECYFPENPLTIAATATDWHRFADHVAVCLGRSERSLIWLQGPAGSGKTRLLKDNLPRWPIPALWLDLRRECEVMASQASVMPAEGEGKAIAPALILDDMSPADLAYFMANEQHPASQVLASHAGPVLLSSRDVGWNGVEDLVAHLGRELQVMTMPRSDFDQRLSVLRVEQPGIERHWGVTILPDAMGRAARGVSPESNETPGGAVQWLMSAAARVALMAEQGDPRLRAIEARSDDLNRALLVARGRGEDTAAILEAQRQIEVERAAYAVDWYEKQRKGVLRQVNEHHVEAEILAKQREYFHTSTTEVLSASADTMIAADL